MDGGGARKLGKNARSSTPTKIGKNARSSTPTKNQYE